MGGAALQVRPGGVHCMSQLQEVGLPSAVPGRGGAGVIHSVFYSPAGHRQGA